MQKFNTGGTASGLLGQSSSLSPWAGPYVTEMLGKGAALADMPYQPYMGPLTAGQSPLQTQAFQGLANLTVPTAAQTTYTPMSFTGSSFAQPMAQQPMAQQPMGQQQFSMPAISPTGAQPIPSDVVPQAGATFDPATKMITSAPRGQTYVNEPFFANKEDYDAWKASQAQPQTTTFGGMNTAEDQARAREMGMTPLQYAQAGGMGANVDQRAIQADIATQQPMQRSPIEQYMSPFLQGALDPQYAAAQRQADIAAQNLQSQYGKAGAYGGSRQGVAEAELQRGLLDRMAGITGTGYQQAFEQAQRQFNTEQDRAMQAARQAQQYGLETLGAQRLGGAEQRAIEGQGIAADIAQFTEERDYPYKQVQYMQSLLQGLPISTQDYQYAEPSTLSNVMGGASGILGLLETMGLFGKKG